MKNIAIYIILMLGIGLQAQDKPVVEQNIIVDTEIESVESTQNTQINTEDDEDEDEEVYEEDVVVEQIVPIVKINIDAKSSEDVIVYGSVTANMSVEIVFVNSSNERISVLTEALDDGSYSLKIKDINKILEDDTYDIFVTSMDDNENKSEITATKGLQRDTTINGMIVFNDGSTIKSDGVINKKELKLYSIKGNRDTDSNIVELKIYNKEYLDNIINVELKYINVSSDGAFVVDTQNIPFDTLFDGEITAEIEFKDEHNNTLKTKGIIKKDTTSPEKPIIIKSVKDNNMIYGTVDNLLVYLGSAELESNIEITIFNTKFPANKTTAIIETDTTSKWTAVGENFKMSDIKNGTIKSLIVQIDKVGNRSETLELLSRKEKNPIFIQNQPEIIAENYMAIHTIKDIDDKVKAVVVSDDYIIAGSFEFIYYFEKIKAKLIKKIEINKQWINSLLITDDKLIVALGNGEIQVRDLKSGKLIKSLKEHKMPVLYLEYDKNSSNLVSSSASGDIIVWDLKTYTKIHRLNNHQWDVSAIAIKDGKIYTGSDDYSIKVWDLKSGKLLRNLKSAHEGTINALTIYKDKLISASDDKTIKVRDLKSGELIHTIQGHKKSVTAIKTNRDILVSASKDRSIILWDMKTYEKLKQLRGHSKSILSLDVSGENIVTGSLDYKVRIWGYDPSLQGKGEIDESLLAKYDLIKSLNLGVDEITALAQTESELVFSTKGYIDFYNNVTYKKTKRYTTLDVVVAKTKDKDSEEQSEEWGDESEESDDEETKSSDDGWEDSDDSSEDEDEIIGWEDELENKKQLREKEASTELQWIYDIDILGTQLIATLGYKNIKIWDLDRNKAVNLLEAHESSVLDINRIEAGFVTSSRDGAIKIWDEESKALTISIDAHQWDVRSTAYDDMKLYSVSDDYSIKIWDIETGDLIKVIKSAHNDNITGILIDENNIITSSSDGTIVYRDKISGLVLKTLKSHSAGVNIIIKDDTHLISGSEDNTIIIWDLKSGEFIKTMKNGHTKGISALMVTDDYIISGGKDKKISIWKYYE